MKPWNPKSIIIKKTNPTHINDATLATKKMHLNMAPNSLESIHMCCSIHIIWKIRQVDMHLTLPTWLETLATLSTTYSKYNLEKPLPKKKVSLNLKFKSTKYKMNTNTIVFIHLIRSMLISGHYKWKRFMGYSKWHNIDYETISLHLKLYCLFKWPASIKLSYQALNYLSGQIIILHHLGNLYTPMLVQLWASLPIPIIYIYHMNSIIVESRD